jgi:hypothetical protein
MKKIEICCTGNSGRSPIAESIGNHCVKEQGLEEKILFISSGTRAAPEWDDCWPYDKAVEMINRAAGSGLVEDMVVDKDRYDADEGYKAAVSAHARKALHLMRPIEAALRNAALYQKGMEYTGKRTQLVPRKDVSLVLGVKEKHVSQIRDIYACIENPPEIALLNSYAGLEGETADYLGRLSIAPYLQVIEHCKKIMPKVIERFRGEHDV